MCWASPRPLCSRQVAAVRSKSCSWSPRRQVSLPACLQSRQKTSALLLLDSQRCLGVLQLALSLVKPQAQIVDLPLLGALFSLMEDMLSIKRYTYTMQSTSCWAIARAQVHTVIWSCNAPICCCNAKIPASSVCTCMPSSEALTCNVLTHLYGFVYCRWKCSRFRTLGQHMELRLLKAQKNKVRQSGITFCLKVPHTLCLMRKEKLTDRSVPTRTPAHLFICVKGVVV